MPIMYPPGCCVLDLSVNRSRNQRAQSHVPFASAKECLQWHLVPWLFVRVRPVSLGPDPSNCPSARWRLRESRAV
eukprot:10720223-Lingulodinium_polyedra.AAC.1